MRLVFDIETDGLKPTRVWCICAIDIDTGEEYKFEPHQIATGVSLLSKANTLIGHNILSFDLPALAKLQGLDWKGKRIIDTLILSRLFKGTLSAHSLAYWGDVFKYPKVEHEDWSQFSYEMLNRCLVDVRLNKQLFDFLCQRAKWVKPEHYALERDICIAVNQMTDNGFYFDAEAGEALLIKLRQRKKELDIQLEELFPSLPEKGDSYGPGFDKELKITKAGQVSKAITRGFNCPVEGPFTKVNWRDQNFNSNQFLIDHLMRLGWEPDEFTPNGNPKLGEEQLNRLGESSIPEAKLLSEWDMVDRRITQVTSWFDALGSDGRVHGKVRSPGTWTYRMTHSDPNMSAIPGRGKPYAHECRSLFTVPSGKKLLGCDASGIQLRVLANAMGDPEYCRKLIEDDIHVVHQNAAGLETRDAAKTFIYAYLLGAGDVKLGQIAGEPPDKQKKRGKLLRSNFLERIPALADLQEKLKRQAAQRDWIEGIDGRRIYVPDPHYALAGLLQADEATIMKKAYLFWSDDARHIDWKLVQWSHDEWQIEVEEDRAEELGKIVVDSFKKVQYHYSTVVQLDGEYLIGTNWSETH